MGRWGQRFMLAVSQRWSEPEHVYRSAFTNPPFSKLGDVPDYLVRFDPTRQ